MEEEKRTSVGPIIGIILILAIIIIGGLYFWGKRIQEDVPVPEQNDLEEIENDLEATSTFELESDLEELDRIFEE